MKPLVDGVLRLPVRRLHTAFTFILMELKDMKPAGIYENKDVTEQAFSIDGEYHDYALWVRGVWQHYEDGNEVPLPEDTKDFLSILQGELLIVGQGSI